MKSHLQDSFARMGARALVSTRVERLAVRPRYRRLVIDVREDSMGPYFSVCYDPVVVRLDVVDVQPSDRHLLLAARYLDGTDSPGVLCGHDAGGWYVAALVGHEDSTTVDGALAALRG